MNMGKKAEGTMIIAGIIGAVMVIFIIIPIISMFIDVIVVVLR